MTFERISTGVAGLDALIEGGIPRGFTVLVAGNPGSGKTVLTTHFLYEGLKNAGESGIYVSFSESKEQFYGNVERFGMDFKGYEDRGRFHFLDLASVTKEGIQDALDEVVATIRDSGAKRMVVDSFSAISQAFDNLNEARIALQIVLGKMMRAEGVTNMLIAEVPVGDESIGTGIEEFVADGIIKLEHGGTNAAPMTVRVLKMRGTSVNREPHVAVIGDGGITVYPRQRLQSSYPSSKERIPIGVEGMDGRTGGGFLRGTATALIGASGVGKTTFAFQFLAAGVENGEPGVFCTLEETKEDIARMAEQYGYDVAGLERAGLTIIAGVAEDQHPDAFISSLAEQIKKTGARRIVVDSISAFEHAYREEMYGITKRLISLMREHDVTSIFTILTTQQAGISLTDLGISSLFQNIVLLRYVEAEGAMKRSMLILKMRATRHDESILEFRIADGSGMGIIGAMDKYVGILTGVAQKLHTEYMEGERQIESAERQAARRRREEFEAGERAIEQEQEKKRQERRAGFESRVEGTRKGEEGDNDRGQ